jgi:GYF domain 2
MSEGPQWYVSVEGQQHGPYSGEQLVEFTGTGNVTRESMVWTEGMAEWLPAAQIEGLFPAAAPVAAAAPMQVRSVTPASNFMRPGQATGYATGQLVGQATGQVQGGFRHPQIAAASFGLWAGSIGVGVLLIIISTALMPQAALKAETNPAMVMILFGLIGVGGLCMFISAILGYMILYRAWKCLSLAGATVTPGAAVGFMFIPLFSLYWIFRAFAGFAKEWNLITSAYEDTRLAPKMSEGLFLTFCICVVSMIGAPIAMILAFPIFSSMCRAINFVAFRPVQQPGAMRFR